MYVRFGINQWKENDKKINSTSITKNCLKISVLEMAGELFDSDNGKIK